MNTLQVPYNGTCHVFTLAVQHQNIAAKDLTCSVWKSLPLGFLIPSSSSCHQWWMKLLFSLFLSLFSSLFFPSSLLVITGLSDLALLAGCEERCWPECDAPGSHSALSARLSIPQGVCKRYSLLMGLKMKGLWQIPVLASTCTGDFVLIIQKQQNQLIHGKQTITRSMCYWGAQITQGHVGS